MSSAFTGNPVAGRKEAITQASVQKMLDENSQLIQAILEYQNQGKSRECVQYQQLLHRNLIFLATLADSTLNQQAPQQAPTKPLSGNSPIQHSDIQSQVQQQSLVQQQQQLQQQLQRHSHALQSHSTGNGSQHNMRLLPQQTVLHDPSQSNQHQNQEHLQQQQAANIAHVSKQQQDQLQAQKNQQAAQIHHNAQQQILQQHNTSFNTSETTGNLTAGYDNISFSLANTTPSSNATAMLSNSTPNTNNQKLINTTLSISDSTSHMANFNQTRAAMMGAYALGMQNMSGMPRPNMMSPNIMQNMMAHNMMGNMMGSNPTPEMLQNLLMQQQMARNMSETNGQFQSSSVPTTTQPTSF